MSFLEIARRAMNREPETLEAVLRGLAVELWSDASGRLFLVADEQDARLLTEGQHVPRGSIYTAAEARCIATIRDPDVVHEVASWKAAFDATVREVVEGEHGGGPDHDR